MAGAKSLHEYDPLESSSRQASIEESSLPFLPQRENKNPAKSTSRNMLWVLHGALLVINLLFLLYFLFSARKSGVERITSPMPFRRINKIRLGSAGTTFD